MMLDLLTMDFTHAASEEPLSTHPRHPYQHHLKRLGIVGYQCQTLLQCAHDSPGKNAEPATTTFMIAVWTHYLPPFLLANSKRSSLAHAHARCIVKLSARFLGQAAQDTLLQ
jgi:hypothetical protein